MEVRFRFSPTHQREGVRNMLMFMLWLQVIKVQLILGQLHLLPPHLLGKYLERTLHLLVICATLRHQLFLASCYLPQKRLSGGSCYTLINNCVVSRYFSRINNVQYCNNTFILSRLPYVMQSRHQLPETGASKINVSFQKLTNIAVIKYFGKPNCGLYQ